MPNKDDAVEPTLNRAIREAIQKIRGIIIPVHGDGACWYRAMAKICNKTPMQFIRNMEQSVLAHKRRRDRTDGNFTTTINEIDKDRVQQKLNHYKRNVPIKDGEEIPTQSIQWWGGNTDNGNVDMA